MLAKSNSEFIEFLKLFDNDILGVVFIMGTVGIFVSFIVVVVTIARTWNNIATARMNQRLVQELLQKGYSVDDIERLAYGGNFWSQRFGKLCQSAKSRLASIVKRHQNHYANQPAPPYKQSV